MTGTMYMIVHLSRFFNADIESELDKWKNISPFLIGMYNSQQYL